MKSSVLEPTRSSSVVPTYKRAPFPVAFGVMLMATSAISAPPPVGAWSGMGAVIERHVSRGIGGTPTTSDGTINFFALTAPSPEPAVQSGASELRAISGLTADQIGRMFGVSRRSIQNWIAGAPMANHHEERMAQLLSVIRPLGLNPEARRAALLRSTDGASLYHRFVAEAQQDQILQPVAVPVRGRLGV